jgi:hypothetical protein
MVKLEGVIKNQDYSIIGREIPEDLLILKVVAKLLLWRATSVCCVDGAAFH